MKKILLLSLFMVFPLAAQNALYNEEVDEFTDIKDFSLFIYADDSTDYVPRSLAFGCYGNIPMLMVFDESNTYYQDEAVTFRFDKNAAFSEDFFVYDGAIFNTDVETISKLLNQILTSTSAIAKTGASEIFRFSDLTSMKTEINKFVRSSRNNPSCDLGL